MEHSGVHRGFKGSRILSSHYTRAEIIDMTQFLYMPIATQALAPPVQNQWYIILDADDVLLYRMHFWQSNGEAAAKNIELRFTADGVVASGIGAPTAAASGTDYWAYIFDNDTRLATQNNIHAFGYECAVYARHARLEIRITSALGTNQTLEGNVRYGQKV